LPAVVCKGQKHNNLISARTIHEIHKLLQCAFSQAIKWELIQKNPIANASKPKIQSKKREIWTIESIKKAIEVCDDTKLALSLQLAFVCTMRLGEIVGLQWDSVDISDEAIENDKTYVYVHQELKRVSREAMEELGNKDVKYIFPVLRPSCSTQLVLKSPKTESSIRKIYIPKTLAYILRRWKEEQAELKEMLQNDYTDYDLIVTMSNGHPVENRIIDRALRELEIREKLPIVVFHSLRHSSATYKLKLTNGAMKDLQREGGWSTTEMIAKVYTHSIEEDRKIIAQKFDEAFYGGAGFDEAKKTISQNNQSTPVNNTVDVDALVSLIQSNPQLAQALKSAMINGE